MGLFDLIIFQCEKCGETIEAQSKGADYPTLTRYDVGSVPTDVAEDANRHAPYVCECGAEYRLEGDEEVTIVALKPVLLNEDVRDIE